LVLFLVSGGGGVVWVGGGGDVQMGRRWSARPTKPTLSHAWMLRHSVQRRCRPTRCRRASGPRPRRRPPLRAPTARAHRLAAATGDPMHQGSARLPARRPHSRRVRRPPRRPGRHQPSPSSTLPPARPGSVWHPSPVPARPATRPGPVLALASARRRGGGTLPLKPRPAPGTEPCSRSLAGRPLEGWRGLPRPLSQPAGAPGGRQPSTSR
jgi:hypothetical protein